MNSENEQKRESLMSGQQLVNLMVYTGILQEVNRSFFHPLGLKLDVNTNSNQLEVFQTTDPKGYLLDRINQTTRKVFLEFSTKKHKDRQKLLGFSIQTGDLYRTENLTNLVVDAIISPQKAKLDLIFECLNIVLSLIHKKILSKHKEKDNDLNPEQFSYDSLRRLLHFNINDEDWADVAAIAMMLHEKDKLQDGLKSIKHNEEEKERNMIK